MAASAGCRQNRLKGFNYNRNTRKIVLPVGGVPSLSRRDHNEVFLRGFDKTVLVGESGKSITARSGTLNKCRTIPGQSFQGRKYRLTQRVFFDYQRKVFPQDNP